MNESKCTGQFCIEGKVQIKNIKIENIERHGDLWCHLFIRDWVVRRYVKKHIEELLAKYLINPKPCPAGCICVGTKLTINVHIKKLHIHRRHLWDSGFLHGNCRLSFDLSADIEGVYIIGTCKDKPSESGQRLISNPELLEELVARISQGHVSDIA